MKNIFAIATLCLAVILGSYVTPDAHGRQSWVHPVFVAADFTGSGAMVWTVDALDVLTDSYIISGKTVTYNLVVTTSSISGTGDLLLQRALPGGVVAVSNQSGGCNVDDRAASAGSRDSGRVYVTNGSEDLLISHETGSDWNPGTDHATVNCSITFEIE
jgi:hypothetical protein